MFLWRRHTKLAYKHSKKLGKKDLYKHSVPVEVGAIAGMLPTLFEGVITTLLSNTGLAFLFPYYTSNKMMKCCTMITKVF